MMAARWKLVIGVKFLSIYRDSGDYIHVELKAKPFATLEWSATRGQFPVVTLVRQKRRDGRRASRIVKAERSAVYRAFLDPEPRPHGFHRTI
jgi:hypothetical protein